MRAAAGNYGKAEQAMMTTGYTMNRTATPCQTAFSTRAFRADTRILADTAFAVSVFVLTGMLCLLAVLFGIQQPVVAVILVLIVRIIMNNRMDSKRKSSVFCPGA